VIPTLFVDDRRLLQVLDGVEPAVAQALKDELFVIAKAMQAQARERAQAHIRFLGARKPGSYVQSIKGDVSTKRPNRVTGYLRSGHPLAHLMEDGFNITDMTIVPGTGKNTTARIGAIMKFAGDAGEVFVKAVHRHATKVPPYPAIYPTFEAMQNDIRAAFEKAAAAPAKT
jgi:hypothetical protein